MGTNRLEAFEDLDLLAGVFLHRSILFGEEPVEPHGVPETSSSSSSPKRLRTTAAVMRPGGKRDCSKT